MLVGERQAMRVSWFENLGGGVFAGEWGLVGAPVGLADIQLQDLDGDGDGDRDLLLLTKSDERLSWVERIGGTVFGLRRTLSTQSWSEFPPIVADMNGDSRVDLVTFGFATGGLSWIEGLGAGQFAPPAPMAPIGGFVNCILADSDADGDLDLFYASTIQPPRLSVVENFGAGSFAPPVVISTEIAAYTWLVGADVDRDGDRDIVAASPGSRVAWYENRGDGTLGSPRVVDTLPFDSQPFLPVLADLTGDGVQDLLVWQTGRGSVAWYESYALDQGGIGVPYCHCESNAPCGNVARESGCANSTGAGAVLRATGSNRVSSDSLIVELTGAPAAQLGLVCMGRPASARLFGAGRLCAGGAGEPVYRFTARSTGGAGSFSEGPGLVAWSRTHFAGEGQIVAGQTWSFQGWFRDPAGPCSGASNLSNSLLVAFAP